MTGLTPIIRVLVGSAIQGVALTADGKLAAIATEKGLFVYKDDGRCQFAYYTHELPEAPAPTLLYLQEYPFDAVAFTPDGRLLVGAAREGYIYAFDLAQDLSSLSLDDLRVSFLDREGNRKLFFTEDKIRHLSLSPDGRYLALGHVGKHLSFIDLQSGKKWENEFPFRGWSVALDAKAEQLVAGALTSEGMVTNEREFRSAIIYLLKAQTGEHQATYRTDQAVTAVAIRPEGGGIVTALSGGTYRNTLCLLSADLSVREWVYEAPCSFTGLAVDGVGRYLAAAGSDGRIYVFDLEQRTLVSWSEPMGAISGVAISADGARIAVGTTSHIPAGRGSAMKVGGYLSFLQNDVAVLE
jgi:WD40 repeat protein